MRKVEIRRSVTTYFRLSVTTFNGSYSDVYDCKLTRKKVISQRGISTYRENIYFYKELLRMEESTDQQPETQTPSELPKWLQKLQNESWQAEMLVGGGAIYSLFSTYDLIADVTTFLEYSTEVSSGMQGLISVLLGLISFFLIVGFSVHLLLRGFWIGVIGLNFAYPQGIMVDRMRFKGKFTNLFKNTSNNQLIINIDKFCSTIFGLTFLSLLSVTGMVLYGAVFLYFPMTLDDPSNPRWLNYILRSFVVIFLIAALITLIDFIIGGRLKRIRWLSKIYYPIYFFISIVTLSILYRRLYYTVVSNSKSYVIAV